MTAVSLCLSAALGKGERARLLRDVADLIGEWEELEGRIGELEEEVGGGE